MDTTESIPLRLPSGKTADLAKSKYGVILSCDGSPSGYGSAYTLGNHVANLQGKDTVDAYGITWDITEDGESEYRYLAEESPQMQTCGECEGTGLQGEMKWAEPGRPRAEYVPHEGELPCEECKGEGEVNVSPWADCIMVKACGLLDFKGLGDMWLNEGGYSTCPTMGSLGAPVPEGFNFGWQPAFAIECEDPHSIMSIYVTPYLYDADGEPLRELSEDDFDAAVKALESEAR